MDNLTDYLESLNWSSLTLDEKYRASLALCDQVMAVRAVDKYSVESKRLTHLLVQLEFHRLVELQKEQSDTGLDKSTLNLRALRFAQTEEVEEPNPADLPKLLARHNWDKLDDVGKHAVTQSLRKEVMSKRWREDWLDNLERTNELYALEFYRLKERQSVTRNSDECMHTNAEQFSLKYELDHSWWRHV